MKSSNLNRKYYLWMLISCDDTVYAMDVTPSIVWSDSTTHYREHMEMFVGLNRWNLQIKPMNIL
jgi:hypothetical protein